MLFPETGKMCPNTLGSPTPPLNTDILSTLIVDQLPPPSFNTFNIYNFFPLGTV